MFCRLFKTGNSIVVSLPKDITEPLGMHAGSDVSVELDRARRQIVIRPVEGPSLTPGVDEEFVRQVNEFIAEYRPALESLASK